MSIPELEKLLSSFEQDMALFADKRDLQGQLVRLASEYLMARAAWACHEMTKRAFVDGGSPLWQRRLSRCPPRVSGRSGYAFSLTH